MPRDQDPKEVVADLLAFIDAAPTPYHAVREVERRLRAGGYARLDEREAWSLEAGSRGYVVRGGSVVAFALGRSAPADAGFVLIGAHTDSPNLRLKPLHDTKSAGYATLAVEVYGSPLLHSWLDRDLGLGGRLVLADGTELCVTLGHALGRIPSLAIHLDRDVNKKGLVLDPQQHLAPTLGLADENASSMIERLLAAADARGARAKDVLGFDLCLFDVQPAARGGVGGELLFAPRLDNLASCHAATTALLAARGDAAATRVVALFDHEEIGSQSAVGARSAFLESVLDRLVAVGAAVGPEAAARARARSLFVSVDMAHGVHPNFPDKHDKAHRPMLGRGPVLKLNVNQSYATDGSTAAPFVAACRAVDVEPQYFVSRNDMPCGSTIGPIAAARLGIRSLDVGNPMLAMHSCRETAGSGDVAPMIAVLSRLLSASGG